ncbi:hypothetical protein D3C81_1986850 [compost metagenome]
MGYTVETEDGPDGDSLLWYKWNRLRDIFDGSDEYIRGLKLDRDLFKFLLEDDFYSDTPKDGYMSIIDWVKA